MKFATASSFFITFLATSNVVNASLVKKHRLLRGSSAVDEESPLYNAYYSNYNYDSSDYNYDSHDYDYKAVAEEHNGQDYNIEEEYPSLYQNLRGTGGV